MENITEGLNYGDLNRLVEPVFGVDQYKSKMGDDKDVCVISFTVFGKEPANDLANFAEKSYDWVLDADVSSGELSDGNYMVFLEAERTKEVPDFILKLLNDMRSVAKMKMEDWHFKYFKSVKRYPATIEELTKHIIASPEEYEKATADVVEESRQLNQLRAVSGIFIKPTVTTDEELVSLQAAAGIR